MGSTTFGKPTDTEIAELNSKLTTQIGNLKFNFTLTNLGNVTTDIPVDKSITDFDGLSSVSGTIRAFVLGRIEGAGYVDTLAQCCVLHNPNKVRFIPKKTQNSANAYGVIIYE